MANNVYAAGTHTGGGPGALDAIDGAALYDGDIAILSTPGGCHFYRLVAASGATADGYYVIAPADNAGSKRWHLQNPGVASPPFRKNFLINGCMRVAQRGTSFSANDHMTVDRWRLGHDAASLSVAQVDSPVYPMYRSKIVRLTLNNKGGSFSYAALINALESQDSYYLVGQRVTLSAWLRRNSAFSAGGVALDLLSGTGTDERYVTTGRTTDSVFIPYSSIPVDPVWERFSLTTTIGTSKTQVGVAISLSSLVPNGAYLDIGRVQLELGATPTPFEYRPFAHELALCQRYYEKSYPVEVAPGTPGIAGDFFVHAPAANYWQHIPLSVRKRANPTTTFYSPNTGAAGYAYNAATQSDVPITIAVGHQNCLIYNISVAGAGQIIATHWTADAEL